MAGLTRSVNIVTSKNRAFPNWPTPYMPSESWPYYGSQNYGSPNSYTMNLPGFLNYGSVGSSISLNSYSSTTGLLKMYNGQGTQQTSGSWNNGFAVGDGSGDYDTWSAFYMDRVDNKLYCLIMDTSTDPDTYRMMTIDKDGAVVFVTTAYQVTNTALNGQLHNYDSTPLLYRVGGVDGTGNFRFDKYRANTPNDNNTQPYDGVRLEINTTSGTVNGIAAYTIAETTDGLIPNNIFQGNGAFNPGCFMGPTDNGIIGAPVYADYRYNEGQVYGTLGNANTGQINLQCLWGQNSPFYRWNSGYFKPIPWLGSYNFIALDQANVGGFSNFSRADMHNFMDEIAVRNGLL